MVSSNTSAESGTASRDQRRSPRYHVDVRLRLILQKDGKAQIAHGRGNDISDTGMAVFVPQELLLEERVEVEFTLPYSRQPLRVRAVIRNRNGFRYGVEFLTLSTLQREEILKLCKTLTLLQ